MVRVCVGMVVAAVLVVSCKDDSTSGTSPPADGGASSSSSSSSGSSGTDSGGSTCGVEYEPVATAAARFAGYWLIDDTGGSCTNASLLFIAETENTKMVGDPDKSNCSPPATFMAAYNRKAKDCLLGDSCGADPAFVFFAHAQPVNPIVPPNELILTPDGSGSYKLTSTHISKTTKGLGVGLSEYTSSSPAANICP